MSETNPLIFICFIQAIVIYKLFRYNLELWSVVKELDKVGKHLIKNYVRSD